MAQGTEMHYQELVEQLAHRSGHGEKAVREILFSLPEILIGLSAGEKVRMPFGVFRMTRRIARKVRIPTSGEEIEVPAEMVVKMRAGARLRRPG